MKRVYFVILIVLLIIFTGCNDQNREEAKYIVINGDIESTSVQVNLNDISKEEVSIKEDAYTGVLLSKILEKVTLLAPEEKNYAMITSTDGISALIELDTAHMCYVVEEEGKLNIKAPNHPRVVGIKDVAEITVIVDEDVELPDSNVLKIVNEEESKSISFGNTKLFFFNKSGESRQDGNLAIKYVKKESFFVQDLAIDDLILYFENYDMLKVGQGGNDILIWDNGRLYYESRDKNKSPIKGIVSGVDMVIYDAFYMLKEKLDKNEKVMFILPDGLSYEQVEEYNEKLSILSDNYVKAASVNPAISNVALASIVTGQSPFNTGIIKREVKAPNAKDIFEYAKELGRSTSYIEGNSTLIVTSLKPILNVADENGYTDKSVFESAMDELKKNPDLIFIHFHGIDDANHKYSPLSKEAEEKVLEIERYIKELVANFDGHVIIVPDHGAVTLEEEGAKVGKHGLFRKEDMYVPFYYFGRGSLDEE